MDMRGEIEKNYKEAVADSVYDFTEENFATEKRRAGGQYARHLPEGKGEAILDIGCGAGYLLGAFSDKGYTNLHGIDVSNGQLDESRKRLPGANLECGSAVELLSSRASRAEKYSRVFLIHVIEHLEIEEALELLKAVIEKLADGGELVLATPNAAFPWASYRLFADLTHKRLYDTEGMTQLLRLAGFSEIIFRPEDPVPFDLRSTLRWFFWKPRSWWLKFMYLIDVGPGRSGKKSIIVSSGIIAVARKS
jgi:cyclopropane fatty-acyl-phospholipid synthase-like methyltransferase